MVYTGECGSAACLHPHTLCDMSCANDRCCHDSPRIQRQDTDSDRPDPPGPRIGYLSLMEERFIPLRQDRPSDRPSPPKLSSAISGQYCVTHFPPRATPCLNLGCSHKNWSYIA